MSTELLLVILGIVLIIEGMPWFLSPRGSKRMLGELFMLKDPALRLLGLVFMLTGLLLVYFGRG